MTTKALLIAVALFAPTMAAAQSLQPICDPQSSTYNKKKCEKQLNHKTEMLESILAGQKARSDMPVAAIAKICREKFVPWKLDEPRLDGRWPDSSTDSSVSRPT